MKLLYAGSCVSCGNVIDKGISAYWDAEARTVMCLSCRHAESTGPGRDEAMDSPVHVEPPAAPVDTGVAGRSARAKYERLHRRRDEQMDARWGHLSGVAKRLSPEPQPTRAWGVGAVGEERLGRYLAALGDGVIVLHDRRMPGSQANIDHIAVAPSGVFVIDAKRYAGMVRVVDVGGWFTSDVRLRVGRRDCTKLVEGVLWQRDAVRSALEGHEVPVGAALCFVEAEWGWFAKPTLLQGVWILGQKGLVRKLAAPGCLSSARVGEIARLLATRFPPR